MRVPTLQDISRYDPANRNKFFANLATYPLPKYNNGTRNPITAVDPLRLLRFAASARSGISKIVDTPSYSHDGVTIIVIADKYDYVACAGILYDSIMKFTSIPIRWITITSKSMEHAVPGEVVVVDDGISGIDLSMLKLKLFELIPNIDSKYILLLDADINCFGDINGIVSQCTTANKIYTIVPEYRTYASSFKQVYHALHLNDDTPVWSDDDLKRVVSSNPPINCGTMLFQNTLSVRRHFKVINCLVKKWSGSYFYEQSFINWYFCDIGAAVKLQGGVLLKPHETPPIGVTLVHHIGTTARRKIDRVMDLL
jgi:hypothetical protein